MLFVGVWTGVLPACPELDSTEFVFNIYCGYFRTLSL